MALQKEQIFIRRWIQKVADYSKFSMSGFDEADKRRANKEQFPIDLSKAFELGMKLGR